MPNLSKDFHYSETFQNSFSISPQRRENQGVMHVIFVKRLSLLRNISELIFNQSTEKKNQSENVKFVSKGSIL